MVTLLVKDDNDGSTVFSIHENLLCNASPFFKAAFQGDILEEGQTSLCLPSVDYDTMNHFVPWLYSGRLSREAGEAELCSLYWVAARLNTLALTYELSGLTEEAVTLLKGNLERRSPFVELDVLPSPDQIFEIYRKSPATNALRKFVVELFGTKLNSSWHAKEKFTIHYPQKCPEFTVDLVVELRRNTDIEQAKHRTSEEEKAKAQNKLYKVEDYLWDHHEVDINDVWG